MDYQKKYESVMDRLQDLIANAKKQGHIIVRIEDIENAITELKENEDDKIRDEIVRFIQMEVEDEIVGNKWLAWFKKQREKKSSDEVLKIRQEVYQSGYNDGYKHGCEDTKKQREEEHQVYEKKHKFIIGDIISNNKVTYRVDNIVKNCIGQDCYFLVNVESEKDGTRYLRLIDSDGKTHNSGEITWLCEQVDAKFKKQVEQKPTDKVEPKFKDGDWIIDIQDGEILHINKVRDYSYYATNLEGASFDTPRFSIEKYNRLWTIQDAKDGDVLADGYNNIGIYRKEKDELWESHIYLGCDNCLYGFNIGGYHENKNTQPATKEQSDILFQKMKEEGCEWDDSTLNVYRSTPKKY